MGEMSLDAIKARNVDERIVCQSILGKNLHDVYSNKWIELAIKRESAKRLMQESPEVGDKLTGTARVLAALEVGDQFAGVSGCSELQSTDIVQVFSPERVGKLCKEFGLEQGMAMDIKKGYDFDLAADRAK